MVESWPKSKKEITRNDIKYWRLNCSDLNLFRFFLLFKGRADFQMVLITIGNTIDEVSNTSVSSPAACFYTPNELTLTNQLNCSSRMEGRFVRITALVTIGYFDLYEAEVVGWW